MVQCRGVTAAGQPCQLKHTSVMTASMRIASAPLRSGSQYCMYHARQAQPGTPAQPAAVAAPAAPVLRTGLQCAGRTAAGAQCRVTSHSFGRKWAAIAAPLRSGGRFCTLHMHQAHRVLALVPAVPVSQPASRAVLPPVQSRWSIAPEHLKAADADSYTCPLCLLVLQEVQQVVACGHNFCRSCLDDHCSQATLAAKKCPLCKTTIDVVCGDAKMQRAVSALQCRCAIEGAKPCEWIGRVDAHEAHACISPKKASPLKGNQIQTSVVDKKESSSTPRTQGKVVQSATQRAEKTFKTRIAGKKALTKSLKGKSQQASKGKKVVAAAALKNRKQLARCPAAARKAAKKTVAPKKIVSKRLELEKKKKRDRIRRLP